jgi:hypothetical protein
MQVLPDYMVAAEPFDAGMHRRWAPGDRFRMYFGGRAGSKQGARNMLPFLAASKFPKTQHE